jgi:uncharacterized membrane protein YgdD (TMEM256/DUF423 family)
MAADGITLLDVHKKLTVSKPLVAGAAGVAGIYLLSKYLQASKENRILNALQQQAATTNALLQRSVVNNKGEPKVSNYPEY